MGGFFVCAPAAMGVSALSAKVRFGALVPRVKPQTPETLQILTLDFIVGYKFEPKSCANISNHHNCDKISHFPVMI